jgi:hypothetical protein
MSFFHVAKHCFKLFRFALIGYRFKTTALPFLKNHLWLHYFYPLAGALGAYPSFIEPPFWPLEASAGLGFFNLACRGLRLLKFSSSPAFLWGSYRHVEKTNEDLTEAMDFTLNLGPSMGIAESGSADTNYGFGGYWGFDQTQGLIGKLNNIKPYAQSLETPAFFSYPDAVPPLYRILHPHPTAPTTPNLEGPMYDLLDKFSLRTGKSLDRMRAINPPKFSDLRSGAELEFYKKFREGPNGPSS